MTGIARQSWARQSWARQSWARQSWARLPWARQPWARQPWHPGFQAVLLLSAAAFALVRNLPLSYTSHDLLIYTLVGQGIYRDGIMPYGLVFDHKPFLTYFIYGPLAFLDTGHNVFALFSVAWLLVLAWIVHGLLLRRAVPFLLVLFLMAAATLGNVGFTGNTEVVYVPLQLLSVGLALGSAGRPAWFVLSALAAVAATGVNYAAGIPLVPALLHALHASAGSTGRFLWRAPLFLAVSLALLAAALGLLALGGADLGNYFALQAAFLSGYAGEWLRPGAMFFAQVAATLAILLLLLVPGFAPQPRFRTLCRSMVLLAVFSLASFLVSSKFYNHYLYMATVPATVALLTLDFSRERARLLLLSVASGSAALFLALAVFFHSHDPRTTPDLVRLYAPLANLAGKEPVMSMRASVVPLYYADLTPFHPLVWLDHAEIIHGPGADAYYGRLLDRRPVFVMTARNWCLDGGRSWRSCDRIRADYSEVLAQGSDWPVAGYSLFRRRPEEVSGLTD